MKKFLSLFAVSALGLSVAAEAQIKKTWDFSKGLSETDSINLVTDATNWTTSVSNGRSYWSDKTKMSGTIMANNEPLEFLRHLTLGTAGLKTNNNLKIGPTAYRMSRAGMRTYLPKLANGQTITVMARSANGAATDRGLVGNDNMTYTSGPANGICLGSSVEGSEGTYTLVWTVETESTDSVECYIQIVGGGVDIQSIVIDNGDVPEIKADPVVAYVYSGDIDADPLRTLSGFDGMSTVSDISIESLLSGEVSTDSIESFDVVILAASAWSEKSAEYLAARLNRVPVLNFTPTTYLGYTLVDPATTSYTVGEDYMDATLFTDLTYSGDDENEIAMFQEGVLEDNMVYGYTLAEGSDFVNDDVYATAGEAAAIHLHGRKNTYMLIPFAVNNYSGDADLNVTDNAGMLISNAISYLRDTKSAVYTASAPAINMEYADGSTTVTISSGIADAKIYYTVDGTEPTTASARYSEPLVFTEATTVKAFVVAPAYNASAVASADVIVKTQLAAPAIAEACEDGYTTISLSQSEGATVYFSFNGVTDAAYCATYSEPFNVTEPCDITFFAAADDRLNSDACSYSISVGGIPAVKDTIAHFTSNEEDWFTNAVIYNSAMEVQATPTSDWAEKAAYYWGKSAWSCYSTTEVDHTETVYEEDGVTPVKSLVNPEQDSIKTVYKLDPAAVKYVYSTSDTQWRLRSQGQLFTGETNVTPEYQAGNGDESKYYAETVFDLIGTPSKGKMTFGGKASGEPFTASIESVVKFEGELDIVTYITNAAGSAIYLELQTSTDQENWTLVDTVKVASVKRNYAKDRNHISLTEPSYIRVAQVGGSTKAQLYDIYVIQTEGTTGIEAISAKESVVADDRIYDLMGRRVGTKVAGQMYLVNGHKVMAK